MNGIWGFWLIVALAILISVLIYSVYRGNQVQSQVRKTYPLDLDVYIVTLAHRKEEFYDPLAQKLETYGLHPKLEPGILGKGLDLDQLPDGVQITPRYQKFFLQNRAAHRAGKTAKLMDGHLGASLTHLRIAQKISRVTLVLEDDAIPEPDFGDKLQRVLTEMHDQDSQWDILLLGMACQYNHSKHCYLNDGATIRNGIVPIKYWFGGWGYALSVNGAAKISSALHPLPWHFDLSCADLARQGQLKAYATIPALVMHPGVLEVSSFKYTQRGDAKKVRYRSDTNYAA